MTRRLIGACFVQARANDGRKESVVKLPTYKVERTPEQIETWIRNHVVQYHRQKKWAKSHGQYYRRRLGYVVRLYAKENES